MQFILQFVGFIHHFEHLYSGSSHHWRNGVRKQIRTRTLTKQVNNFLFAGSKSTYRTTKSFTQCSGNNFNFTTKIVTFSYTTPGFAYHTCRVRFVYHHHSIVFFSQCINFVQRSYVAVHRKNAISHNQSETLCLSLFKLIFQILHICISIAVTLRFAKSHTIYNRSMVQRIRNNSIFFIQQRFKNTTIGIKAGSIQNSIFRSEKTCNRCFQLFMNVLRSTNKPHRRNTVTVCIQSFLGSFF